MEKLLTPEELSDALGVKVSTIYSWSHKKIIPRAANMRLLRFRESEVLAWIAKVPQKVIEKPSVRPKTQARRSIGRGNIDALVEMAKKEVMG